MAVKISTGMYGRMSMRLTLILIVAAIFLVGCGGMQNTPPVTPRGNTKVVVLLTGTANDQVTYFRLLINNIALTDSAGNSVTLFNNLMAQSELQNGTEPDFIRLNGASEPLVVATVPQGTYTSATMEVGLCQFGLVKIGPQGMVINNDACANGVHNAMVNLSAPISVSGSAMALTFNLQVSQSLTPESFVSGVSTAPPVFTLTPVAISSNPTNELNGKINGLDAQVTAVDNANGNFAANRQDGSSFTIGSNASTQYQGITGLSALTPGMVVNLDTVIQSDGTLQATRVEVQDPAARSYSVFLPLAPTAQVGTAVGQHLDCLVGDNPLAGCLNFLEFDSSTQFHVTGQLSNLDNLPFAPTFDATNLVLGQTIGVLATGLSNTEPALDMVLNPQTLNGIVVGVSQAGGFSVFTVSLAPYDLFPVTQQLSALGSFASIANPSTVTVYVDANAQLLQTGTIAPGSLLRFRGAVFNDGGALRMDCTEVLDGVAE